MLKYVQLFEFIIKALIMRSFYNYLYNNTEEYAQAFFYSILYLGWNYNIYIILFLFFLNKIFSIFSNLNEKKIIIIIFFIFQIILSYFFFGLVFFLLYEHFWKIMKDNFFFVVFNNLLVYFLVNYDFYDTKGYYFFLKVVKNFVNDFCSFFFGVRNKDKNSIGKFFVKKNNFGKNKENEKIKNRNKGKIKEKEKS